MITNFHSSINVWCNCYCLERMNEEASMRQPFFQKALLEDYYLTSVSDYRTWYVSLESFYVGTTRTSYTSTLEPYILLK